MSDHATMTAATFDIVLGGTTYHASPLTLKDFGHIEQWARGRIVAAAAAVIVDQDLAIQKSVRGFILNEAYKAAACMKFDEESPELQEMMQTIGGIVQIIWVSVRRNHDITCDALADTMTIKSRDEFELAATRVLRESGMEVESTKDDTKSEPEPERKEH